MQLSRWELFPPIGFLVWTATILYLSLHPSPPEISSPLFSWDKFQHAAAFGILAFLGGLMFLPRVRRTARGWLLGFIVALAIGALVEILQGWLTPGRVAEFGDLIADALGAAAAALGGWAIFGRRCPVVRGESKK